MSADQTWQAIAREWVEPWEGCRAVTTKRTHTGVPAGVSGVVSGPRRRRVWNVYFHGKRIELMQPVQQSAIVVDLTHPPTAREAVARLALFLGAPEDAVAEGVVLWADTARACWLIQAGYGFSGWAPSLVLARDAPANNRPLAIATAWMEARKAREREG